MDTFNELESHTHNGKDSLRLNPVSFMGFPITKSETKFTHKSVEGKIAIRWKTSDNTYYLAFYANGDWREAKHT